MSHSEPLLQTNLDTLAEGLDLLRSLPSGAYTACHRPTFLATIGAHYRHLIEHYQCFIAHYNDTMVCYDARARDSRLEHCAETAINELENVMNGLRALLPIAMEQTLTLDDQQGADPVHTTIGREFLFLQAHTVHHYAMIAAMARLSGVEPAANFGVAVATRAHSQWSATG